MLADPWLKEYVKREKVGQTLFASRTEVGENVIREGLNEGYIEAPKVSNNKFYESQVGTIIRKQAYRRHPRISSLMERIYNSQQYKRIIANRLLFKLHCKFRARIENYIIKR